MDDLAAVCRQLAAAGVAVTPMKRRWGAWVCYCRDPEGHRIELWADGPAPVTDQMEDAADGTRGVGGGAGTGN